MCRFVMYEGPEIDLASLVTRPRNSLVHQSYHSLERREPLNGDGFGLAWYRHEISPEPALFRSVRPAWNDRNLHHLARVTRSRTVLAHVRAASHRIPVSEVNCHPFVAGPFAFMHNGQVAHFPRIRRELLASLSDESFEVVQGSTDSELLFAVFLDRWAEARATDPLERMAEALVAAISQVLARARAHGRTEVSRLNLVVGNGREAVACRFADDPDTVPETLYVHTGRRYVCEGDRCRMVEPEAGHDAVLVSSERLSDDPGWRLVPRDHLVLVDSRRSVTLRPLVPDECG
ncbi:MAG: class II glutamine amidotransferase [Acidobacteria bacterium]|nr:MAG: class II glutamine amidotransferase [Acidobacteriota bacterium]